MPEESTIVLNRDEDGNIQISPSVLEIIAGIAANEIDGVSKMHGSIANNVGALIGLSGGGHRRGVKLAHDPVNYGVSVPKVATEIQTKVSQQIELMTDLHVSQVNVHVQGIVMPKQEQQVDPNNIFANDEEEGA